MATNPYHPYRILIIGGSGSGKTNSLFNLINHQDPKDPCEAKYQFLITKMRKYRLKRF